MLNALKEDQSRRSGASIDDSGSSYTGCASSARSMGSSLSSTSSLTDENSLSWFESKPIQVPSESSQFPSVAKSQAERSSASDLHFFEGLLVLAPDREVSLQELMDSMSEHLSFGASSCKDVWRIPIE